MSGIKDPHRYDDQPTAAPVWPGKPVTCRICLQGGVPTLMHDGWRMPVHNWDDTDQCGPCPGSMGGVEAPPVPADMAARIEQTFVAAMPPGAGTVAPDLDAIPPASRLDPSKGLFQK